MEIEGYQEMVGRQVGKGVGSQLVGRSAMQLDGRVVWRPGKKRRGGQRSTTQKRLTMVQCWLTRGQKSDEKMQPILWTEQPTSQVHPLSSQIESQPSIGNQNSRGSLGLMFREVRYLHLGPITAPVLSPYPQHII